MKTKNFIFILLLLSASCLAYGASNIGLVDVADIDTYGLVPIENIDTAGLVSVSSAGTCSAGTINIQTGGVEEFENSSGDGSFCDDTHWTDHDTDGIIDTYSNNAGTLIDTRSLEIDDDATGGHSDSWVTLDLGETDNDYTIRFKYKAEVLPDDFDTANSIFFGNSTINVWATLGFRIRVAGNNGTGADGPAKLVVFGSDDSGDILDTYEAGTTVCIEIDVNAYTGAGDTSTITIYASDCSTVLDSDTFEINDETCRYLTFSAEADTIDHHYGIDDIELKAAGGGF